MHVTRKVRFLLLLFFFFYFFIHYFSAAPVQIIETVPNADFPVSENRSFSILCNVEGSPGPTATWSKLGGEFIS